MLLLGTATGRSAATRAERTHLPQHDGVREVFARFLRLLDRAAGGHVDLDRRLRLLSVLLPEPGGSACSPLGVAMRSAVQPPKRDGRTRLLTVSWPPVVSSRCAGLKSPLPPYWTCRPAPQTTQCDGPKPRRTVTHEGRRVGFTGLDLRPRPPRPSSQPPHRAAPASRRVGSACCH